MYVETRVVASSLPQRSDWNCQCPTGHGTGPPEPVAGRVRAASSAKAWARGSTSWGGDHENSASSKSPFRHASLSEVFFA